MNVVLFGATGYLGSHVAEQLILAGHSITCPVRPSSNIDFLTSIHANIKKVDFYDSQNISTLIPADSTVINCIADTRPHASYDDRKITEIDLTAALFNIAQTVKAKRFIQLSTVMVYGFDRPDTAINEYYPLKPKYIYNQIAVDREKALLRQYNEGDTELIILRPSNTLGKRDTSFLPNFVNSSHSGIFPVVGGGNWSFSCIDSRDVGRAMVHLLDVPAIKPELFLVKGFDIDWLKLKTELDHYLGKRTRLFNLPKTLILKISHLMELIYPYSTHPPMTRFDMEVLSTNTLFDDSKIRTTGFIPKYSLLDSFQDAIEK